MAGKAKGRWLGLLVGVVLFASQSPLAQEGIKLESNLVSLDVTILDREGNHVTDLQKEDFGILHDGLPQPVVFFDADLQRKLSRPLAVVFALDMSGSLGRQITDQQHAARQFANLIQRQSIFAVIGFNDKVHVLQKFTNNPTLIGKAFDKAGSISGRTRLYDALDRAVTMLVKDAPEKREGRRLRRVVIVITDGFDYTSIIDRAELIRRANTADVTIYSVTLPSYVLSVTGKRRVPTLLDASGIVAQTGGRDFSAEAEDFSPIFQAIAEEIKASYTIAYYPPTEHRQDGKFHQVTVTLNRPDLIVRQSRSGYLSPGR